MKEFINNNEYKTDKVYKIKNKRKRRYKKIIKFLIYFLLWLTAEIFFLWCFSRTTIY